jgi:hypothetical protein
MVDNVNQVLLDFNDITNVEFDSDCPTANLFLPELWRMKEFLIIKCEDRNYYIRLMVTKMAAKFDKYWGDSNLLMSLIAI